LVTGATRGIGKGIALQLGEAGATVYITGRTLKPREGSVGGSLEETAEEITKRGGKCIPVVCNHGDMHDVEKLFERIKDEQDGRLDVLVNNAYSAVQVLLDTAGQPFWETSPAVWDDVNNVGLRNHYFCTVYASRMMVPRKQGLIVNVSSPGGLLMFFNVAYGVGKEACDRMAQDTAAELKAHNVAVVSLWPGQVKTEVFRDNLPEMTTKEECPDFVKQMAGSYDAAETIEFAGKCIAHLATDAEIMAKTGKVITTADLAEAHGITDIDGTAPKNYFDVATRKMMAGMRF